MKLFTTFFLALFYSLNSIAQEKPVKIVFDVTSDNTKVHQSTMRHVKAMSKAYPDSQFEVVMYSGAMDMVLKGKSSVEDDMKALAGNDNVSFVICQGTMKRHEVDESELIEGVTTVPDGILEIIEKQGEGWGYIKEGQ
ncbi:MAG: DsrE family protein [Flavobacteriaceae bacterium]